MSEYAIEMLGITKRFPGIIANDNITLQLKKGEIHALLGENGAGKSTLMSVLFGLYQPEEGEIHKDGKKVEIKDPNDANDLGIGMVHQHFKLVECFSVLDNIILGVEPSKGLFLEKDGARKKVLELSERYGLKVEPDALISDITVGMQQRVEILKMLYRDNEVLIFDEPTALLENEKVEILFKFIAELKEKGVSIIYISHRLEEVMDICDTVTVLKDGTYVDTKPISAVTKDSLIAMMVGREMSDIYNIGHQKPGEEVLRVENFCDSSHFKDINFNLKKGEILGFVGLVGAGRSEVMRAMCGVEKRLTGDVYVKGEKVNIKNPSDAMRYGISFLTEDRRTDGLALQLPIKTNINMNSYAMISKGGVISLKAEQDRAVDYSKRVNVKTPSVMQLVGNLSGGNQQKVVIAKLLCCDPDVLIFDEPTVGVDVGAKEEIYKIMEELTAQGKSIILISSYLPEVMGLSDRLIVMAQGKITGEFASEELKNLREEDVLKRASIES